MKIHIELPIFPQRNSFKEVCRQLHKIKKEQSKSKKKQRNQHEGTMATLTNKLNFTAKEQNKAKYIKLLNTNKLTLKINKTLAKETKQS